MVELRRHELEAGSASSSDSQRQFLGAWRRPGTGPLTDEEIEAWAEAVMDARGCFDLSSSKERAIDRRCV
jgi:hypothetical protein